MTLFFDLRRSTKSRLESPEKFIVTRGGEVFLRVLGQDTRGYQMMTATAGEDDLPLSPVKNQRRLIEAGLRLAADMHEAGLMSHKGSVEVDAFGREYVKICAFEFVSDAHRVAEMFFGIYDSLTTPRAPNELRELYVSLAADDDAEPVYLSDGLWLGSDGSLSQR